jgi:hypothetical protein
MYGNISVENTMKLLIRCKILFGSRHELLVIFQNIIQFDTLSLKLFDKIKEEWQKRNQVGAPAADMKETKDLVSQVQKLSDAVFEQHFSMYNSKKYK